ncbi:Tho complex subunit 7 [Ancylostoma duodenale]|uniref:Tho complex subunit 7 n=1 Tax=Ancylostoma duodenale TaxID=51022 RepID=A0A0C2H116_9BILA|nr:Tho complex subunit 7 [Ancylostoma duodenale]
MLCGSVGEALNCSDDVTIGTVKGWELMREEILLRKLLADGEGTGEERRFQLLNACLRSLRNPSTVSKAEAVKALRLIDSLELSMRKQREIADMSGRQTREYEEMAERVDKEIAISREKMAQAKKDLTAARLVRKNRKEYALLVGMIDDLPSRAETTRKLEDMQEELAQQQERQQQLEARLSERRNHLHALNIILANFQKLLADEDSELANDAEPGEKKDDGEEDERSQKEKSADTVSESLLFIILGRDGLPGYYYELIHLRIFSNMKLKTERSGKAAN